MADTNTTPPAAPAPKKKKKRSGPIRWEAIIPFIVFVAIVWAYFFFFFDTHVRRALEYVGTQANGAEVNIDDLDTSFWNADLRIRKIQVTDASEPAKNKVQIGEMNWRMLWDALLRGKVAIQEASILEVAIGVPRARPGRVIPPTTSGEAGMTDQLKEAALNKIQEEFSQNILGDVAAILGGVDPSEQLKNIEGQLKSSGLVKQLETELKAKEVEWKARIDRLPHKKDIDDVEARFKAIKLDRFNGPLEVAQSVQQIDALLKDVNAKIKDVQETGKALGTDVNTYSGALRTLADSVRQDIKDLEQRLKIPKLDVASISRSVFGPMFLDKVRDVEHYVNKARQYMPPKKTPEEKAAFAPPTPHERAEGRNYKFGQPNAYPLFWLREAKISSKATPGADWSGNLEGALKDVTDDPPTLGRPTIASFKGEFPKQGLWGIDGAVTIDHVTDQPRERLDLKVASFLIGDRLLINSPDVKLGIGGAEAGTTFLAELRGREFTIKSESAFRKSARAAEALAKAASGAATGTEPNAATGAPANAANVAAAGAQPTTGGIASGAFLTSEAKQPILASLLKGALSDIPLVTLNASASGQWSRPEFHINSNLGSELARAFDKQIQVKIAEARAKLEAYVNAQIGEQRARLEGEFNKVKGQVDSLVKDKQAEVDRLKDQLEKAKNDALKKQGLGGDATKKGVDKLKKRFGF